MEMIQKVQEGVVGVNGIQVAAKDGIGEADLVFGRVKSQHDFAKVLIFYVLIGQAVVILVIMLFHRLVKASVYLSNTIWISNATVMIMLGLHMFPSVDLAEQSNKMCQYASNFSYDSKPRSIFPVESDHLLDSCLFSISHVYDIG